MAFSPYFPGPYQSPATPYQVQAMQQQLAAMQQPTQQQSSGIIWVQGTEAMKSYPVAAGQSVLLMDSESNCFGIKTVDASGMPLPLRIFDYKERNVVSNAAVATPATSFDGSVFVTRDEFESRIAQICAEYGAKKKQPVKKEAEANVE